MAQGTHAGAALVLGSEFDNFLFAHIDSDRNGKVLSVLSMLARLDVDPRQEAAKLARMPSALAIEQLTSLIASLPDPDPPLAHRDPSTVAARLAALLPRSVKSNVSFKGTLSGAGVADPQFNVDSRFVKYVVLSLMITGFILGSQLAEERRQPPAQMDSGHATTSSTLSPHVPTADSVPSR
jgi:hypothetical protein